MLGGFGGRGGGAEKSSTGGSRSSCATGCCRIEDVSTGTCGVEADVSEGSEGALCLPEIAGTSG